jgi:polyisoprenoid-binding protein YceI
MDRRLFLALLTSLAAARPATAAPRRYLLDREASVVAFQYDMNGQRLSGRMPVLTADILLDFDRPSQSRISAELDAAHADAGLIFATDAMHDDSVLATSRFPTIGFRSQKVEETATGALLHGALTIRDVTRPVTLEAVLYRQRGTVEGDRTKLSILMTGRIDRRDYGAGGFPQFVGPMIGLKILTRITLA